MSRCCDYDEKNEEDHSTVATSAITFVETEHGRLRRKQRGIDKKDLQAALKYGERSPHCWAKSRKAEPYIYKYTHNEIVYIVNEKTKEEVTCYARPLKLEPVPLPFGLQKQHEQAQYAIHRNLDSWTSHTVLVVDTSGSMKTSDMWGTRNRLDSVWVCVALDFIAHRLESGAAQPTDLVSVVTMGATATVLIREAPCTWQLYNQVVAIYNRKLVPPQGPGHFLPSLTQAEELLTRNSNAACATALLFLSDGVPSDGGVQSKERIVGKVENLAKNFGRRLAFTAIGIGDKKQFDMLQQMVDAAKDYGAISELRLPSMTSSSLGNAFTSLATSLTTTQTEMTDLGTTKQRKVRAVARESRTKASEHMSVVSSEDFYIYRAAQVKRTVYREWLDNGVWRKCFEETPLQHPDAKFVAFSKGPFGEGAERFAYRFFELAADGKTIVGPPMVAKESRMVLEEGRIGDEMARKQFVRTFCFTQQFARRLAIKFNDKLDATRRVHPRTPRVSLLDCSIYQLDDKAQGKLSVLVENKLDHTKWHKWNSNAGFVEGMKKAPRYTQEKVADAVTNMASLSLGMIEEGSEDDEDSEAEEDASPYAKPILFSASEVAQAFSHFTYVYSGRKRLVCDLQGVFDERLNLLQFSDPVIHYHHPGRTDRRCVHGRTDRGRKGIDMFFETHREHHGHLCRLMTRGLRPPSHVHHRNNHRNYN
jgi:Mg-chelatase subunit ChlD